MAMTATEFAKTIKTKYPSYANIEDNLLVKKVLEKYPTYRSQVDFNKKDEILSLKETAKNIIPSGINTIKHLGEGIVSMAEAPIKTGINLVYGGGKYATKQAVDTATGLAVGAGTAIGQGTANLIINPVQSRKDIGKFIEKNPTEIAASLYFMIPGATELAATKTASLMDKAATGLARRHIALKVPTGKGVSAMQKTAVNKQATEIASKMLKEGVIDKAGRTEKTLENVNNFVNESGQGLATIREGLQESGMPAIDPFTLKEQIVKKLSKPVMTVEEQNALDKTIKLIDQVGDKPLDFKTSQALTSSLQQNGKYVHGVPTSDAVTAKAFSRAGGIASDMLDEAVERAALSTGKAGLIQTYNNYKKAYSMGKGAQEALATKLARKSNNMPISLPSLVLGGGGIAHGGGLEGAAVAIGAEMMRRYGLGAGANVLKYGAKGVRELGNIGVPKGYLKYSGKK